MAQTNLKEKEETTNNVTGLFIEKIQIKENRALITLKNDDDKAYQVGNVNMKGEITQEFADKWETAKDIVSEINPKLRAEKPSLRLNFIQFYYDKNGYLSDVSFSLVWTFDSQGHILNLNYQKFPIYKPEMAENVVAISGKHEELLHEILKEAKDYMGGKQRIFQPNLDLKIVK